MNKYRWRICSIIHRISRSRNQIYEYFLMPQYSFNMLSLKIQDNIRKQDTHWRLGITPIEELKIFLR